MALNINGASFAIQYKRTQPNSIDSTDVWETLEEAQAYASNVDDVVYMPINGQVISVIENNKTYKLVPDESIPATEDRGHYKLQEIATTDQLDDYLSKDLFSSVFGLIDADGNELDLHDEGVVDLTRSIQAKFGLWTNEFLSAKGLNPAEGEMSITLKSLNDVKVSDVQVGESLVWNGSYWVNQLIEGGGFDESELKAYLDQNNYITSEDITTALASYATIALVNTKVDSSTFNTVVERIDGDIENLYDTKASKEELAGAKSELEESINNLDSELNDFKEDVAADLKELNDKKLDISFFNALFGLVDTDGNEIIPNTTDLTAAASIKAKFGLWTEEFLSAKGLNPENGEISITLKSLNDVAISNAQIGESLVYNGTKWVNQLIESEGIDEEALEEYLNQKDYATNSDITTALSSYATITLVNTKVDSSTFNSTVERIDKDLEDVFADLNTKATKEELSAVSSDLDEFKTETNTNINNLQSDISELDNKKLNVDYFQALFGLIDSNDTEVIPNTEIPETIKGIKAKFGLWTEEYLSALGMNPANGEVSLTLASLNDVQFSELTEGQSIVWNGTKWINQLIESGGLDESQLEDYLSRNSYATTQDITDAISSKVDTSTFNSTISDLNTSISDLETELETKAGKDELSTAVSTINTRIDGVVTDINTELATKATKTELTEAVTTLEQSISDVDDDLQTFKTTTEENLATKLDIAFFSKIFGLIGEDGSEITVNNDTSVTIESIQAKFGLWTEQFLSAKGLNPSDGSVTGISLKDLAGVNISSPQNGEGLVYQDGYWVNQVVQTGEEGNPFYVWQGETADAPTLNNAPANQWTTTALKNEHIDDYYITTKGIVYQFTNINGTYSWELVTDKYLIDCWNKLDQFDDDLTERIETIEESITSVSSAVSAEVERAKGAEQKIADDLLALVNKLNQMFTLEGDGSADNPYRIKANYGLYTDQFLSALGANT